LKPKTNYTAINTEPNADISCKLNESESEEEIEEMDDVDEVSESSSQQSPLIK
jgi:hypothetical protein